MKFIYGADWHFRHTNPKCRTDNYAETIRRKIEWLKELKKKYDCPILNGGDLLDKDLYKSPVDVVLTLKLLAGVLPEMIGIIGNHDLLARSYEYLDQSTISVLIESGKLTHLKDPMSFYGKIKVFGFDYGTGGIQHPKEDELIDGCNIAILHEYVSKKPNSLFGKYVGIDLLKEFPEFDIILTGDNHITFTEEYDGRFLINPGSFLRMDADQIDHKPCVFIIDTDDMSFTQEFVPIEDDVISREHIHVKKDREERIESFVTCFEEDYEVSDSFQKNLKSYMEKNKENYNSNVEKFIEISIEGDLEACGY